MREGARLTDRIAGVVDWVGDIEIPQSGVDDGGLGGFELAGENEAAVHDPIEMQPGGSFAELVGTISVLGTFHPVSDDVLGCRGVEAADVVHHRRGVVGEQRYESSGHHADHEIDLCGRDVGVVPCGHNGGPQLEALHPTGLGRSGPTAQSALIGHPASQ